MHECYVLTATKRFKKGAILGPYSGTVKCCRSLNVTRDQDRA